MGTFKLDTAVAFCVFNRLETTARVLSEIRKAKPPRLYIIADGPRPDHKEDKPKVEAVRRFIEENIDWECSVYKNYSEDNLGCGRRMPSGLDWVFETEEEAIVLEDDCVPLPSFFQYCQEMLEHYRYREEILMISGNNPYSGYYDSQEDYFFTKVPFVWGWATWRRAWKLYDFDLESLPDHRRDSVFKEVFPRMSYWVYMAQFETLYKHQYDAWDYQLLYAGVLHHKLNIAPAQGLVKNIGLGEESTHTGEMPDWMNQDTSEISFPISFREEVVWDRGFDMGYFKNVNRHGLIVKMKQTLGLDINKSVFSR